MTTNFITPPDFVEDPNHNILLVDVDPVDVETLAFLCANHDESFNVYLYKEDTNNVEWLNQAALLADAIIVNTIETGLSSIKDRFVDAPKTYHYGPKNFLNNSRRHNSVLDYFIQRANERKQSSDSV